MTHTSTYPLHPDARGNDGAAYVDYTKVTKVRVARLDEDERDDDDNLILPWQVDGIVLDPARGCITAWSSAVENYATHAEALAAALEWAQALRPQVTR